MWDVLQPFEQYKNQGKITGILSWGLYSNKESVWDGALGRFSWSSDGNDSVFVAQRRLNDDDGIVIGYGSGNEDGFDICADFELSDDEYIDGYEIYYADFIYGLIFHSSAGIQYQCLADNNTGLEYDQRFYYNRYLSGFIFSSGEVIDGIQFEFTELPPIPGPGFEIWQILLVAIVGALCILGCIAYIVKNIKHIKPINLKNPMVITIGIAFYQRPKPKDAELRETLADLDGIRVDIHNSIGLFRDKLNYRVYPDYSNGTTDNYKAYWDQDELVELLEDKANALENNLQPSENESKEAESSRYDGLIVEISCHGMDNDIITSDYKRISKTAIHRIFSAKRPAIRNIPRVFIFDCCSGINDRDTDFRSQLEQDEEMEESSSEEEDEDYGKGTKGNTSNSLQTTEGETGKQYGVEHIQQDDVLWARDENNPDFKLAVINAANEGFQSKMSCETGSYVITTLMEKLGDLAEKPGHKEVLQQVLGQIQEDLHQRGKQLLVMTFNNKTENLRFLKNETKGKDNADKKESMVVEMVDIKHNETKQHEDKATVERSVVEPEEKDESLTENKEKDDDMMNTLWKNTIDIVDDFEDTDDISKLISFGQSMERQFKLFLKGMQMDKYYDRFKENEYCDMDCIPLFDEETLEKDFGIMNKIHRKKFLNKCSKMKIDMDNFKNNYGIPSIVYDKLSKYGIVTINILCDEIKDKADLVNKYELDDENQRDLLWNLIQNTKTLTINKTSKSGEMIGDVEGNHTQE